MWGYQSSSNGTRAQVVVLCSKNKVDYDVKLPNDKSVYTTELVAFRSAWIYHSIIIIYHSLSGCQTIHNKHSKIRFVLYQKHYLNANHKTNIVSDNFWKWQRRQIKKRTFSHPHDRKLVSLGTCQHANNEQRGSVKQIMVPWVWKSWIKNRDLSVGKQTRLPWVHRQCIIKRLRMASLYISRIDSLRHWWYVTLVMELVKNEIDYRRSGRGLVNTTFCFEFRDFQISTSIPMGVRKRFH